MAGYPHTCPCCGGHMEIADERAVVTCVACGTVSRIPDERVRNRPEFRNAREMQKNGDYPNAEASYLRVLDFAPDDADALWGRLLCHYGAKLEVDRGGERRYTVRRARPRAFRAQGDFARAIENAPPEIAAQYERDAAYIDGVLARIQNGSTERTPYDIFICHKTTTLQGEGLTRDYERGRDLYDLLTAQGYKAFFAPVMLSGVAAGEDYEAAIYHALYTAKVMVVVCSDKQHLYSTWVRSEWERFLGRRDEGDAVTLIPLLFGGMKGSDLPRDFGNLQAIEMEVKGTTILLNRLQRLLPREKAAETPPEPPKTQVVPEKKDATGSNATEASRKGGYGLLTAVLVLLVVLGLMGGGSWLYARQHGLEWPQGVLAALFPAKSHLVSEGMMIGDYTVDIYSDSTCVITGYSGETAVLDIPAELDGYTVISIGDYAFENCDCLIRVSLPDTVTHIGDFVFKYCTSLTSVSLPDSIMSMGVNPFVWCRNLENIIISAEHPKYEIVEGVLYDKNENMLIYYPMAANRSEYAIPEGVLSIGISAFEGCNKLEKLILPDGMEYIGDWAFSCCHSLVSLTLPDSLIEIGDNPFVACVSLDEIDFSVLPAQYEVIDGVLYDKVEGKLICYPITESRISFKIAEGVISIGNHAFYKCNSLQSITMPDGVVSIGYSSFYGCDFLTNMTLPSSVTSIGDYAFAECDTLEYITLPASVTSIGNEAFTNCPNLTLLVPRDSYAATYAQQYNIPFVYID